MKQIKTDILNDFDDLKTKLKKKFNEFMHETKESEFAASFEKVIMHTVEKYFKSDLP